MVTIVKYVNSVMAENSLYSWPQAVSFNKDDNTFTLNEVEVEAILKDEKVKDKPVCVVSVAGAFRKGKSFLLNFMLRYLKNNGEERDDWMGAEDKPLEGFHWRGGADGDTHGILICGQSYKHFTIVNYDSRVIIWGNFKSGMTLEL